jgi:hypothetical protein
MQTEHCFSTAGYALLFRCETTNILIHGTDYYNRYTEHGRMHYVTLEAIHCVISPKVTDHTEVHSVEAVAEEC